MLAEKPTGKGISSISPSPSGASVPREQPPAPITVTTEWVWSTAGRSAAVVVFDVRRVVSCVLCASTVVPPVCAGNTERVCSTGLYGDTGVVYGVGKTNECYGWALQGLRPRGWPCSTLLLAAESERSRPGQGLKGGGLDSYTTVRGCAVVKCSRAAGRSPGSPGVREGPIVDRRRTGTTV